MAAQGANLKSAMQALRSGKRDEARKRLEQAAQANANDPEPQRLLARMAREAGDNESARSLLQDALSRNPKHALSNYDLGVIELDQDRHEAALECFARADAAQPDHPVILLHKALSLENLDRGYEAAAVYQRCWSVALGGGQGFQKLPAPLQQLMTRGRGRVREELKKLLDQALEEARNETGEGELSRMERLEAMLLGEIPPEQMPPQQKPTKMYFPGLPDRRFFERDEFPWITEFEARTDAIREEFLALNEDERFLKPYMEVDPSSPTANHWREVSNSLNWGSCHLFQRGERNTEVEAHCPTTFEALDNVPLIRIDKHCPECMFSVLKPGITIPPHHGSVNGRVIIHLPLIVPRDCGGIRVGNETRYWEEGKCIIFDDSYEHEAWNKSDETRVVLIIDAWNPHVTEAEKIAFARFNQIISEMNAQVFGEQ